MRTILKVLLLGATGAGLAACQVPECKLTLTCPPPPHEQVYLVPTPYSPTDGRVMLAPDHGMTLATTSAEQDAAEAPAE